MTHSYRFLRFKPFVPHISCTVQFYFGTLTATNTNAVNFLVHYPLVKLVQHNQEFTR